MKIIPLLCVLSVVSAAPPSADVAPPKPRVPLPWPSQFHMDLNRSGLLAGKQSMEIWYDYPGGRQIEIFNKSGKVSYINHRANGSFYSYTPGSPGCKVHSAAFGLLRPTWTQNGSYHGQKVLNGRTCDVWNVGQSLIPFDPRPFITFYDDASTGVMVREVFFVGVTDDVVGLEPGKLGTDEFYQLPADCFTENVEMLTEAEMRNLYLAELVTPSSTLIV